MTRGRALAVGAAALLLLFAAYWFVVRAGSADPHVVVPKLAASIGEGDEAVGVAGSGAVVRWLPLPEDPPLPRLSLEAIPEGGRVRGPALEQVRVLAAVPDDLRPYLAGSAYGESGVDVELTTGVELRFGDASQARRKWRAAAAVLADPSVTALDYVDLRAPSRPTYGGSEHELPPPP
ncbi:MAG TPA: cell division protein FtsQ/DivIB [Solirubrobacterales bacterium]|nr:cell division protein FtsQ/DivIB [Solirubrobacterales bacterium]